MSLRPVPQITLGNRALQAVLDGTHPSGGLLAKPLWTEAPITTETELVDFIEEAIADSIDEDRRPIHSARAVAYALIEHGIVSVRRSPERVAELASSMVADGLVKL